MSNEVQKNGVLSDLGAAAGREVRAKAPAIPWGAFLAACVAAKRAGQGKDAIAEKLGVPVEQITGKLNSPVPDKVLASIRANPKMFKAVPTRNVERTFKDAKTKEETVKTVAILDFGFTGSRASADLTELADLLGE